MRIQASSISSSLESFSLISSFSIASSTNFLSSSTLNSPRPSSSSSIDLETRCEGLDLLVKAVLYVTGSMLVAPFTQKRVIRRRKRALSFSKIFLTEIVKKEEEEEEEEEDKKAKKQRRSEVISRPQRRNRVMALPSKYHDSVLQPWKRRSRGRKSIEIDDGSG